MNGFSDGKEVEGFYTKQEAAKLLGVSSRQINNYFNDNKLRKVYRGTRVWIPKRDVHRLYGRTRIGPLLGQDDLLDMKESVEDLQQQVETLKLGLGYGSKKPPRSIEELLLIRQQVLDSLAKDVWHRKWMSEVADRLMDLQAEEVELLVEDCGVTAWTPLCDLSHRMLCYIEARPDYPGNGLDVLETRLLRSRDRFFGLVYSSSKIDMTMSRDQARKVHEALRNPPGDIEKHIVEYLTS